MKMRELGYQKMITYKTSNFVSYKEKVSQSILSWSFGREKALNVVAVPYSSPIIFLKIILHYIENEKKVLYITGESEDNIQILSLIKKYTDFREYSYVRNSVIPVNSMLAVCDYKSAVRLKDSYDLVIYDDTSSFSEYNSFEIMDLVVKCAKDSGKIIVCAVESIFKNQRDIIIPIRENKRPLIEPRYVITRIDLSKEMPYMIYDYLNFSVDNDRKVIVYVPNSQGVHSVFSYLCNFRTSLSKNIMYYINGESYEKVLYNFAKIKRAILVTDDYKDRFINLEDTDIIVYTSHSVFFDYKKLIYFCGKAGRSDKLRASEVIFLANSESYDMDKAKGIIRYFNKEAWEMGLLSL
jgi:late competence protein required for DNA uptake (superfamily II DNA/RNA helicase)